jgi:hypothetical protein
VLTLILARELHGRGVTANTIAPRPTATELFFEGKDQEAIDRAAGFAPPERLGAPEDIAEVIAFLAGPGHWANGGPRLTTSKLIWRMVCQGGAWKFRRERVADGGTAGVSGGRDVGLGDGVASLICGDFGYPMALFLLPAVRGSRNERGPDGLLIVCSRVPAAVSARRPRLLSRGCCC